MYVTYHDTYITVVMLARYLYWKSRLQPVLYLFRRKNIETGPGIKGCRRSTGTEKNGCFAHVVPVWHVEHIEKLITIDTKRVCWISGIYLAGALSIDDVTLIRGSSGRTK